LVFVLQLQKSRAISKMLTGVASNQAILRVIETHLLPFIYGHHKLSESRDSPPSHPSFDFLAPSNLYQ
jgi:hypothetical protein